jgi:hypothetical protein
VPPHLNAPFRHHSVLCRNLERVCADLRLALRKASAYLRLLQKVGSSCGCRTTLWHGPV